jgi:hypothetical protein
MLLFVRRALWSIIDDSGFVVSSVVSANPALLSFHMLAGNLDRARITKQLAPDVLAGWKAWAAEHAKAFQRASSAVEGRNGALAQLHHNQRGLPKQRYKVWTVLHNFDCRAPDGTTPAARFFRRGFPDLFETVLLKIDDLPRPRKRNQAMALSG